jgi:hypothetical protein
MGNTTREIQHGWVMADLDNAVFTDIVWDTITTDRSYVSNIASNLYGLISTEQTTWFSGELVSSQRVEYDNSATGVVLWLPTAQIRINTITRDVLRDTTRYSSRGLPIEKKDPLGNTTTFIYDERDIALLSETNPLGWAIGYGYSYPLGKPTTIRNQNNIITKFLHDVWGRELSRSRVSDWSETLLTSKSYDDMSIPNSTTETSYFTLDSDNKSTKQYSDGWGRPIMTTTSTEKLGQYSTSQIRYDQDGNPIYVWYPVFTLSNSWDIALVSSGVTDGEIYRNRSPGVVSRANEMPEEWRSSPIPRDPRQSPMLSDRWLDELVMPMATWLLS